MDYETQQRIMGMVPPRLSKQKVTISSLTKLVQEQEETIRILDKQRDDCIQLAVGHKEKAENNAISLSLLQAQYRELEEKLDAMENRSYSYALKLDREKNYSRQLENLRAVDKQNTKLLKMSLGGVIAFAVTLGIAFLYVVLNI